MIIYENMMFQLKEREKAGNMFNICVYTKCDESQHQFLQENMRDRL